jgi:redox-regulated HSP33 family molecular chaperone
MRDNGYEIQAELISSLGICGTLLTDILKFDDIISNVTLGDSNCDGFMVKASQYDDQRGVICYPYTMELFDEDNNSMGISSPIYNSYPPTDYD